MRPVIKKASSRNHLTHRMFFKKCNDAIFLGTQSSVQSTSGICLEGEKRSRSFALRVRYSIEGKSAYLWTVLPAATPIRPRRRLAISFPFFLNIPPPSFPSLGPYHKGNNVLRHTRTQLSRLIIRWRLHIWIRKQKRNTF